MICPTTFSFWRGDSAEDRRIILAIGLCAEAPWILVGYYCGISCGAVDDR
jgi:hypothetical protein